MHTLAAKIGKNIGPDSLALTQAETQSIWEAVNLFHADDTRIEILMPQLDINLTGALDQALNDIRKREGAQIISCKPYTATNIEDLLRNKEPGVKQIIITTENTTSLVGSLLLDDEKIQLLKGRRLLNIKLPDNYRKMKSDEKTVHQAKIVMLAIFARLLEKESTIAIRAILIEMLKEHLPQGAIMEDFLDNLAETEDETTDNDLVKKRIRYSIGCVVRLVEQLGEELKFITEFWRSA